MAAFLMIMQTLLAIKLEQTQKFLQNGSRIPVTKLNVPANIVMQIKNTDKHGYSAIQLGIGNAKKSTKPLLGHAKSSYKNNLAPKYIKEAREEIDESIKVGDTINPIDVLVPGDLVNVVARSKGKGFAGGVKRHHFQGGPRTHGQSDRERAPGSIGQTTTPGRVYKGKRMAGNMGKEQVTVRNLEVVLVENDNLWLKGLVPGSYKNLVVIKKVGQNKKFTPLFSEASSVPSDQPIPQEDNQTPQTNTEEPEVTAQDDVKDEQIQSDRAESVEEKKEEKVDQQVEEKLNTEENMSNEEKEVE